MAYTPPTSTEFLARFAPKFATVSTTKIDYVLAEAVAYVDDSWGEDDRTPAILYLTAHMIAQETGQSSDRSGSIVSESFGPMSISYGGAGASLSNYDGTEYGRRFFDLLKRNFPGVVVV